MKIRNKLLIGFSLLMAILLVLTFVSYDRMKSMNDRLEKVYHDRYLKVRYSGNIRLPVNEITKDMLNVLIDPKTSVNETKSEIDRQFNVAVDNYKLLEQTQLDANEQAIIQKIINDWTAYSDFIDKQFAFVGKGDIEGARANKNSVGTPLQNSLLQNLNSLSTYQDMRVDEEIKAADAAYQKSLQMAIGIMTAGLLLALGVILWVLPSITKGLNTVSLMINSFGKGKYKAIRRMRVTSTDEIGRVAKVFQQMSEDLDAKQELERKYAQAQKDQAWISSNLARITDLFHGISSMEQVSQMFISEFTPLLGGKFGTLYIRDDNNPDELYLAGSYGMDEDSRPRSSFKIGEGLVGQSAADKKPILLDKVPEGYVSIRSASGESEPRVIMIQPVVFEDELLGVVEIASLDKFTALEEQLLSELVNHLGVILNNMSGRLRIEELLRESQALTEELQVQSEELQSQQEELRRSNENLEKQATALKRSEDQLQRQQEELEHYNTELVAKTRALEEQVQEVEEKNSEIEKTKNQLEQQAMQLSVTSKYKSEFLANMSHELRTPLNSLLILSQLLSENKEHNLTDKQIEYAQTIYMSGSDLLKMIDEILDLSKVDAGKMEINRELVSMQELEKFVEQNFGPVAQKKQVDLNLNIDPAVPEHVMTDGHRLKQIVRNLLSNAFKFTEEGSVTFSVREADPKELPVYIDSSVEYLAISVQDTGIGIPQDKTDLIFEAFQQVDGTTSRQYGGTGLGLSISRGLASLLGGGIALETAVGEGSTFTLYLPKSVDQQGQLPSARSEAAAASEEPRSLLAASSAAPVKPKPVSANVPQLIEDDRDKIGAKDRVLLVVEDDVHFAKILVDMARNYGYKVLTATQGDVGLHMARSYLPDAIILDIQLPVMDGWSILNELKSSAETRHIPVHVISVVDDVKHGLMMGAIAFLKKPSSREDLEGAFSHIESYMEKSLKHLLVVEDDQTQRHAIIELIGHDDVVIKAVSTGREALEELRTQHFDCMVLDLMLTDMTGFDLLDQIRDDEQLNDLPIIIYTGKELDKQEETKLRKYAESIIIKDVKSPERLLDETTLFLHRVEADLPEEKRRILRKLHNKETLFEGKKILLVDDDVRNVFALSSVLEGYRMEVVFAENGREAIELLEQHRDFDLILMDMMMPEMDGYEAMRRIRTMEEFEKLPIIALTAKAMKEDRVKCIEAGASDYMKKPIQTDQLLSLMRVWLYS
ncbi:response regulator [Paenibacillus physcomitrellae]|uniref:histidine kinase n=1 Tax=Paenibacillus physcomitrellae TaxID=1619311 RepID=A0ABQ1GV78_9BACL|nr:response regulator [Paenibacillus physcomitrellae]GGA50480.1 two-component system sensor histidine kinase/response regulator [Paenibacillus physcomitrellae]